MGKPRVLISTDIGGSDPDDIQSMVHALLYADKINLVGLVSTPTKHGGRTTHINQAIDAYAKDYSKLKTWSNDYPTPTYLKSIVSQGKIDPQPSQGWSSPTAGSQAIIKAAHASSEPLWVLAWGAMTDVAQALHDDPSIKSKIKVYSIGSWNTQQDPAARNYVYNNHKDLWWIENNTTFRGMYVNDAGQASNSWKMSDAQGHGALGDHFYKAMPWGLKMGDTPSLLYLLDTADNNNPTANSWGGSFVKTGHGPNYWTDNKDSALANGGYHGSETVQKHQATFYADFVKHLDRAKASNPNGTPTPTEPKPTPTPTPGGNPVTAVDDDMWKTGVNQTMWQNARYLTWNDIGPDGGLKVTAVASKSAAGASVSFASDGTITYKPVANWQGKDYVEYTVTDADGSKDTGKFYIQVGTGTYTPPAPTPTEPAPTPPPSGGTGNPVKAVDDDMWKTGANQTMWQNARYLTWNDVGPDGGLKVTAVATKSAAGASVSFASDGTITYKPVANWQGKDYVEYILSDVDGSTDKGLFYVQVGTGTYTPPAPTPTEPAPTQPPTGGTGNPVTAVDDSMWKTGVNQTMWQNARYLTWNDIGPDGGLKVTAVASKSAAGGSVSFASDGTITYKPVANWQGKDYVEYILSDVDGSTDKGLFYVQVGTGTYTPPAPTPTEPAPTQPPTGGTGNPVTAVDDHWNVKANGTHYFNTRYVLQNDKAPDGGLKIASIGTTTVKGGTINWDASTGTTIYKPKAGFVGKDSVAYTAIDVDGSTDSAVIHFDVLLA